MFRLPPTRILRLVAAWGTFDSVHFPQNATAKWQHRHQNSTSVMWFR